MEADDLDLNKFLRRNYFHLAFFFFISGIRYATPEKSFNDCVDLFFRRFKINEKKYTKASMVREFERIQQEFDRDEIKHFAKEFSNR